MKFNVGLGLSFGAMVVACATIKAITDCNEKKQDAKVEIARINAEANQKTKKTVSKTNNEEKK